MSDNTRYRAAFDCEREFVQLMISPSERETLARLAPETADVMGVTVMTRKQREKVEIKGRRFNPAAGRKRPALLDMTEEDSDEITANQKPGRWR